MEVICNIVGKIKIPKQQPGKEEDKMGTKLAKILDECLARTDRGESIDACLSDYTEAREQIEPLLRTAISFSSMPEVAPSDSYKKTTKRRLMATLHQETFPAKIATLDENMSPLDNLAMAIQRLWQTITGARKIAIPVTLGLILAIVAGFGASSFISPSPALADGCTLSIISGTVDIQAPTSDSQPGINGMTLDVGTRIQTGQDATALLTFFDGSTLKLEPGTDIEIQQLEFNDEQSVTIVLKQLIGRTWSHVVKMADKGSHYEIITPSAVALVRGTQFVIDVDEEGNTREQTTEGLVSVIAQGEEVSVPVGYITMVETGTIPSEPTIAPDPEDEDPQNEENYEPANHHPDSNYQSYTLTVQKTTGGNVTLPGEGVFTYDSGTVVNLQAVPESGYHFVNWSGPVANPNAASTTITMTGNITVTAHFAPDGYTLTIICGSHGSVLGPGIGTFVFQPGTIVNLEVKEDNGYEFSGWSGNTGTIEDSSATTTKIHMNGNYIITANFVPND